MCMSRGREDMVEGGKRGESPFLFFLFFVFLNAWPPDKSRLAAEPGRETCSIFRWK
jgi:hypothetical protein